MKTERFVVKNMKCMGCVNTINGLFTSISEVKSVNSQLPGSSVEIIYDSDQEMRDKFAEILKQSGYPPAN